MAKRKEFLVRLDPQVHDALRRWADGDLRSLNAQIEFLLRQALERAGRLPRSSNSSAVREENEPES
jgi:hypothetical protein